ncbi:hypothetical protein M0R45_000592 [Rubus argutus]|uniref:Uncharacterized protein n=1 Tax=Rubus argutus TaxID=59490 RepID=A0AAW1VNX8_RUBAR
MIAAQSSIVALCGREDRGSAVNSGKGLAGCKEETGGATINSSWASVGLRCDSGGLSGDVGLRRSKSSGGIGELRRRDCRWHGFAVWDRKRGCWARVYAWQEGEREERKSEEEVQSPIDVRD